MPRVVSFLVLLAIVLLIGAVFFQVMAKFLLPMFLAAVLVVIFKPVHQWVTSKLPGRPHITALVTTLVILLTVLAPTCWLGWRSFSEFRLHVLAPLQDKTEREKIVTLFNARSHEALEFYEKTTGKPLDTEAIVEQATRKVGGLALSSAGRVASLLVGTIIMAIALYYFLADGPAMIRAAMQLSPLDEAYEKQLLEKFSDISRAVVLATLLSAVLQGLAASVGFYFALPAEAPIVLLTAITMVCAIIPFVGATAVWLPVCIYIAVFGERVVDGEVVVGNWPRALILAIYCAGFVSTLDNFVKPWVLHGQANLHPLLALLSVIGGVQALGPIGILVGPMIVSFLQALLTMLNNELRLLGNDNTTAGKLVAATSEGGVTPLPKPAAKHKKS